METARSNTYGIVSVVCSTTPGYVLVIADKPEPNTRHIVPVADLDTTSSNLSLLTIADVIERADYDLDHWREERHNGWSNVETWEAFNWLSSREDVLEFFQSLREHYASPDRIANAIRSYYKEFFVSPNPMHNSFLECARSRINWAEITEKL